MLLLLRKGKESGGMVKLQLYLFSIIASLNTFSSFSSVLHSFCRLQSGNRSIFFLALIMCPYFFLLMDDHPPRLSSTDAAIRKRHERTLLRSDVGGNEIEKERRKTDEAWNMDQCLHWTPFPPLGIKNWEMFLFRPLSTLDSGPEGRVSFQKRELMNCGCYTRFSQ